MWPFISFGISSSFYVSFNFSQDVLHPLILTRKYLWQMALSQYYAFYLIKPHSAQLERCLYLIAYEQWLLFPVPSCCLVQVLNGIMSLIPSNTANQSPRVCLFRGSLRMGDDRWLWIYLSPKRKLL